uniref:Terpene synthase 7 n=1 Tax=Prunella vulgaris TaxID=39358 RepID=A0A6B7LIP4_PRUVU|nr:terpene synthase 7 [Prunella vulgaris]
MEVMNMSSLPLVYNSFLNNSLIPKKVTPHLRINGHGRITPRLPFQPSAVMTDGSSSSSIKQLRPLLTTFTPSFWGDTFSTFSLDNQVQQNLTKEIESLKKEIRSVLMAATSTKLLILIDKLERLGLSYHFDTEIEDKLKQVCASTKDEETDDDLFTTALRFRLLRQHRCSVSCNVFMKFVDKDNKLDESLISDVEGLLSLHEAAHVRIHDENVLEEAIVFTTHHLNHMLSHLESPLKEKVQQTLTYPFHKTLGILNCRFHIESYQNDDSRDELVLKLAKLNFNFMQNCFRKELVEVTTWWKNFNLESTVPYVRDRLVECFIWALSFHSEYAHVRICLAKFLILHTTLDDIYDNYATLEELEILTEALDRWDAKEIDGLPETLRLLYKGLLKFTKDLEDEARTHGKQYMVPYFIDEVKRGARSCAMQQAWFMEESFPSFKEYMIETRIGGLINVWFLISATLIESSTKATIDWMLSEPDVIIHSNDVGRLLDDIVSHNRESKDGTIFTPMDCYMKEMKGRGVSEEEAISEFRKLIEDSWKHLTAAWVNSTTVQPKEIVVQLLDFTRACGTFYVNEEDGYTYPEKHFGPLVGSLLLGPMQL